MTRDESRAWWTTYRAKQGLPPTIEDPATIERVAAILRLVDPDALAHARRELAVPDEVEIGKADFEARVRAYIAEHPEESKEVEQAWQRMQAQRAEKVRRQVHPRAADEP